MNGDLGAALDAAEEDVAATVAEVLAEVADEFAAALDDATEIVAARFSVARIASMWRARVPRLVRRLLGVVETAAVTAAESVDAPLPDGWDDLPGRYDDDRQLPASLGSYVTTTEHLLRAVGDRLSAVAVAELAAGLDAGEDIEQLRARLRDAFAREGAQLGAVREERIARTESGRAWNTATLAAGRDLTEPERPLVKQWLTRFDTLVRDAHANVNGMVRPIDEPFTVAGVSMSGPCDPTAPPELVINCRCVLALAPQSRAAAFDSQDAPAAPVNDPRETGVSTRTAAADGSHRQGAMIALIPTPGDAAHLAIPGGEPEDELHLTLVFLGEGADWSPEQRAALIDNVRERAAADLGGGTVVGRAFGSAHWNPDSDTPSWVWSVGDDRDRPDDAPMLYNAGAVAFEAVDETDGPPLAYQHTPWVAHVCAAYSDDPAFLHELESRLGPIEFDRIRVAFAGEYTDIPIGPQEEPMQPDTDTTADGLPARAWSTPDDTALAFENQETGDGRIFAAGSLHWDTGPWPLQYADEMLMGHEGAELAGAIESMSRDGDRLAGTGVIYTSRPAGQDAVMLLEESAPLGVSVDLDDVALEFVDRTYVDGGDDEEYALAASLASASLLRLPDGAWMITARTAADWTASGSVLSREQHTVQLITGPGGVVSADAVRTAFAGTFTAAAGDPDDPDGGLVVHSETTGDFLLRITKARVRGATLVAMPAYDRARIVLDPLPDEAEASGAGSAITAAEPSEAQQRVIAYVSVCPAPVGAREVAQALGMKMETAKAHLTRASKAGHLVRLASGLYVGVTNMPEGTHAATLDGLETVPDGDELLASAWTAMRDMPPMPASWFRQPTAAELPPGSGGVHYAAGRVYGWVAQAGEPHAGMPGRNLTIESLGSIDLSHFLRARFSLDDGSTVKVGAFTMNVPHHRDGAECESAACQFDDSRTVAGIVTVGMSAGGMWFSGAASPWLSDWDRKVFSACQPSYHMRQGRGGKWELRAVLSVPVPGHSSPLLAAAVAERAQLALAASAAGVQAPDTLSGHGRDTVSGMSRRVSGHIGEQRTDLGRHGSDTLSGQRRDTSDTFVEAVSSLLTSPAFLDEFTDAMERRKTDRNAAAREEIERLSAAVAPARREIAASMAGAITTGGK
ncbi:phage minor head protein [Embleya sp. NPDC001921]